MDPISLRGQRHDALTFTIWGWTNLGDQFRLWQRNSQLAPQIPLLFGEKSLKTVCYHLCIFKLALKWTRSVCLRAI
jgi:hypothetical protein